jgi:hypothetical protein
VQEARQFVGTDWKAVELMSENQTLVGLDATDKHEIKLVIVYGVNRGLDVRPDETIDAVKLAAMSLFAIAESDRNAYVLKAKIRGTEEQLDEAKTVESSGLHNEQKVMLAAGTPFGNT